MLLETSAHHSILLELTIHPLYTASSKFTYQTTKYNFTLRCGWRFCDRPAILLRCAFSFRGLKHRRISIQSYYYQLIYNWFLKFIFRALQSKLILRKETQNCENPVYFAESPYKLFRISVLQCSHMNAW